jgi:hypothetical protein
MRSIVGATLIGLALALSAPRATGVAARDVSSTRAKQTQPKSPVSLTVATGYGGHYRASAWVPIRVTLQNRSSAALSGSITVPDQGSKTQFAAQDSYSVYQMPVVLPAEATKQVTMYVQGRDFGDAVRVQFVVAGKTVGATSDSPTSFDDQTVSLGALATAPDLVSWLRRTKIQNTSLSTTLLSPATLDPIAEALANFDAILLTNFDTSRLDREQMAALERYVRAGGSLILVGGPDWQETLRPLPSTLVPGNLRGARTLGALSGLQSLAGTRPPVQRTIVTVLDHPRGSVVASQAGLPLVVRQRLGQGRIIYLAFDPAVDAFPRWHGAVTLLSDLVTQAAPQAVGRVTSSGQGSFFNDRFGPSTMRQVLANVPDNATWPSLFLLIALVILSILIVGPVNFMLLRRLGKRELAWVAIPVLGSVCLASSIAVASHLKGNMVLLNTVGVVELDGNSASHPATLYVGLLAPIRGDYRAVWDGQALPQSLPQYFRDPASAPGTPSLGVRFQEGSQTAVDFPSMNMWSTRTAALRTSVTIPGTVRSNLHLAADGSIVGTVHNGTNLLLVRPIIMAGRATVRLSDMPPTATRRVRIRPHASLPGQVQPALWDQIYGATSPDPGFGSWDGDPWEEPPLGTEASLSDRLRNAAERLPEARDIAALGEILFLGWSQKPLGTFTVDGAAPQRRDLNLIASPLSVHFPRGPFRLLPGTIGANLVDARPRQPQSSCCFDSVTPPAVAVGPGGSATFQFDLPVAPHIHFRELALSAGGSGGSVSAVGQAYDWPADKWVDIGLQAGNAMLPRPDRFISSAGALQVRLRSTAELGDLVIADPHQDLQLSGWATSS